MASVIQVVFAALVHNPKKFVFRGSVVRYDPIDFAGDQGSAIPAVIDADRKRLECSFHSSRYLLIFKSLLPIPWAWYSRYQPAFLGRFTSITGINDVAACSRSAGRAR